MLSRPHFQLDLENVGGLVMPLSSDGPLWTALTEVEHPTTNHGRALDEVSKGLHQGTKVASISYPDALLETADCDLNC